MPLARLCQRAWCLYSLWLLLLFNAQSAVGQSALSTHAASIPLAVRSPYLHAWVTTYNNATTPPTSAGVWPLQWNRQLVGWIGFIRVDGQLYQWLGVGGGQDATSLNSWITPAQSIFSMRAGPVIFNVTFLSPVEPEDWIRQSLPFSYIAIDAVSDDDESHSVQVYTDVTGEFISPNLTWTTRSQTLRNPDTIWSTMQLTDTFSAPFAERGDLARDATLILATANTESTTTTAGSASDNRAYFDRNGRLTNQEDSSETPISPSYPIVGLAIDLGNIRRTPSPSPALFALGILRDPVIQLRNNATTLADKRSYYTTRWPTTDEALKNFIADFPAALSRANALDARIMSDALSAGGQQYADLVGLSVRQIFASFDLTAPEGDDDIQAFMKDIGESRRVNPVDTLYAAVPGLLYLNASLPGLFLDPLLEKQSASNLNYAVPDLGSGYPVVDLNINVLPNITELGVDTCASLLIISLVYAQKSGEGYLLERHYDSFKKWADFLVENSLRPTDFATSDGLKEPNNSNLALKGILGIYAMSLINRALEGKGKAGALTTQYSDTARDLYSQWENLAYASGRVISSYNQPQSWTFAYNLFYAKFLGADFVSTKVYEGQTAFHRSQMTSVSERYGIGYDSNQPFVVKSHWTLFTAATMTDDSVRDGLIKYVHERTFLNGVTLPFTASWDSRSASTIDGQASPVQGAQFALLALKLPDVPITFDAKRGRGGTGSEGSGGDDEGDDTTESKGTNVGAIAGGVVGGLVAITLIAAAIFFLRRRRGRTAKSIESQEKEAHTHEPTPFVVAPAAPPNASAETSTTSPAPTSFMAGLFRSRNVQHGPTSSQEHISSIVPYTADPTEPTAPQDSKLSKKLSEGTIPLLAPLDANEAAARGLESATSPTPNTGGSNSTGVFTKSALPQAMISSTTVGSTDRTTGLSYTSPTSSMNVTGVAVVGGRAESESSGSAARSRGRKDSTSKSLHTIEEDGVPRPPTAAHDAPPSIGAPASTREVASSEDLRAEVLALRREMEAIRAQAGIQRGSTMPDEPPPMYSS